MNVAGVIAEFNPLHNSHKYILDKISSENDITAVILGGNFMQRGGPSVMDFYDRAVSAVKCGADVVLLLPYVYAAQTAEVFAWGGVSIADMLGIKRLYFGSEDDTLPFYDTARLLSEEPAAYKEKLRNCLDCGLSFATARENAVKEILGEDAAKCLRGANNILSTEYTKAIIKRNSNITPVSVKRVEKSISATKIREIISRDGICAAKEYLPEESYEVLNGRSLHFSRDYEEFLYHTLLILGKEGINDTAEVETGLQNRICDARHLLLSGIDEFCDDVSSKRFTKSRIRRILYNSAMGYKASDLIKAKSHTMKNILALAANEKGRQFIKGVNQGGETNIISNLSKAYDNLGDDRWIYDTEIKAYGIYHKDDPESLLKKHTIVL